MIESGIGNQLGEEAKFLKVIEPSGKMLGRSNGEVSSTAEQMIATGRAIDGKIQIGRTEAGIDTNRSVAKLAPDDLENERETEKIND